MMSPRSAVNRCDCLVRRPGEPYPYGAAQAVLLLLDLLSVLSPSGVDRELIHRLRAWKVSFLTENGQIVEAIEAPGDRERHSARYGCRFLAEAYKVAGHEGEVIRLRQEILTHCKQYFPKWSSPVVIARSALADA